MVSVQKNNRKGEGSKRESAFVSQEIQSIHAKQVLFLIVPNMPPVSCLEEWLYLPVIKKKRPNINSHILLNKQS